MANHTSVLIDDGHLILNITIPQNPLSLNITIPQNPLSLNITIPENPLSLNPALQYFFVVCLALQGIFGTLGNVLVIGAVCIVPALRTTSNAFIINLSLADLLVTCVTQPSSLLGAILGEGFFNERHTACSVVGTLCAMGCIASTWNIFMISLNRFILICYFEHYERVYTKLRTLLMCAAVWLLIYLIELPNQTGWGDTRFSTVFYVCTFANHVHSYALFYIGVGVCLPVAGSFFCYLGIYLKVRNSSLVRNRILMKRETDAESSTQTNNPSAVGSKTRPSVDPIKNSNQQKQRQSLREFHKNVRVAKALFRVFVIFLIMWLPVAVLILMGQGTRVHPVWYILTVLMAHGNSSINCLVYALSLDHFRDGYLRLLGLRRCRPGAIGPDGRSNTLGGNSRVNGDASSVAGYNQSRRSTIQTEMGAAAVKAYRETSSHSGSTRD
ncbi:putative Melatonin receptor type 1B-B [Hypsibius exemplaris]|uniref:Melatonin receptor type 1B-B n=1 Tax=Hypsibius exemplaris TaxID=2072580 RepID=A0A9X6RND8_HYPEX|nr:putative Melatonin receptor type 1B-B [Hypsibius exemplaris]